MLPYKADPQNPKLKIGTLLRVVKFRSGSIKSNDFNVGQYWSIVKYRPSIFNDGRYAYEIQKCSKTGKLFKQNTGFDQSAMEFDLASGTFEIVK